MTNSEKAMERLDCLPFVVDPLRFRSVRDLLRFLREVVLIWRCAEPGDLMRITFRVE